MCLVVSNNCLVVSRTGQSLIFSEIAFVMFVFITSIKGTPLMRGRGHFFKRPKCYFNLH